MPELYELKVYQSFAGRSTKDTWVNTHHVRTDLDLASPTWQGVASDLVEFHSTLALDYVYFMRVVISTVRQTEIDPSGEGFRSIDLSGRGLNPAGSLGDPYDINFVQIIKRNCETGRAGRLCIRGMLAEGNVNAAGNGKAVATAATVAQFEGFVTAAVAKLNTANVEYGVVRTKPGPTPGDLVHTFRPIMSYQLGGIELLKRDHKFFNRKAATPAAPGV